MLNVIKSRSNILRGGELIDLDVEGFIYEQIEGDDIKSEGVDLINLRDLESF